MADGRDPLERDVGRAFFFLGIGALLRRAVEEDETVGVQFNSRLARAVGYNTLAIPIAAGLFADRGFVLRPEIGALAMSGSSIVVAINAVLLRRVRLAHLVLGEAKRSPHSRKRLKRGDRLNRRIHRDLWRPRHSAYCAEKTARLLWIQFRLHGVSDHGRHGCLIPPER